MYETKVSHTAPTSPGFHSSRPQATNNRCHFREVQYTNQTE